MPIIRCTKKLQREMGLRPEDLSMAEPESSPLNSWHANLLYIDRRKCVLFTNDRTLFNFLVPAISRAEIRNLGGVFLSHLSGALNEVGLPKAVVEQIMTESPNVTYGNTSNRSVLGSMNDFAFHYKHRIHNTGGVDSADVPGIIRELNDMPMRAIKRTFPIVELKALYGIHHSWIRERE